MNLSDINKFVINMPERSDRLVHVTKQLEGWDYSICVGFKDKIPMLGIAKSHMYCVGLAKKHQWPYVLIMEDDLVLRSGAVEYLNKALCSLPDNWDILLGGLYETKSLTPHNEYWDKTGEFCGLHFYIVSERAYNHILAYDGKKHIDRYMKPLNCYVTSKFIATQLPGKSDNTNRIEDYEYKLKKFKLL